MSDDRRERRSLSLHRVVRDVESDGCEDGHFLGATVFGDVDNLGVNAGTVAPMAFFNCGGCRDLLFGDLHARDEDAVHFYTDKAVIER